MPGHPGLLPGLGVCRASLFCAPPDAVSVQRLNTAESEEPAGLQGAMHLLREAAQSQGSAQLANTLQECLQALIDSSESSRRNGSLRFKPSQEEHGAAQSGERRACESAGAAKWSAK